jgi:hypothetical protein
MNKDTYKLLKEKTEKVILPFDPFLKKLKQTNDWTESFKICIERLGEILRSFGNLNIQEGVQDDFKNDVEMKIYETANGFHSLMRQYASILHRHYSPLSTAARKNLDQEMESYWNKIKSDLEIAQKNATAIKGRANMLNLWDDEAFSFSRKFVERVLETSVNDIKDRMNRAESPLGDDVVEYEEGE